jgi:hypothetical protein
MYWWSTTVGCDGDHVLVYAAPESSELARANGRATAEFGRLAGPDDGGSCCSIGSVLTP